MRWPEIDWDNRVWVIPKERTKTKRHDHHVPLSDRAIEILHMRKQQSRGQFVFYGWLATQPLSHFMMRLTVARMGVTSTIHGFRSTFKQWAGEQTEYPRELVEICLEHKVGNAVEEAYWRSAQALDRRRPLMDDWASFVVT
jgi:integrase